MLPASQTLPIKGKRNKRCLTGWWLPIQVQAGSLPMTLSYLPVVLAAVLFLCWTTCLPPGSRYRLVLYPVASVQPACVNDCLTVSVNMLPSGSKNWFQGSKPDLLAVLPLNN